MVSADHPLPPLSGESCQGKHRNGWAWLLPPTPNFYLQKLAEGSVWL